MNSLLFNPQISTIDEWANVYLQESSVEEFQTIIDRSYSYLIAIKNGKMKTLLFKSEKLVADPFGEIPSLTLKHLESQRLINILEEGEIERYTADLESRKDIFKQEYKDAIIEANTKKKVHDRFFNKTQQQIGEKLSFHAKSYMTRVKVCQKHLEDVKRLALDFYEEFISKENKLLREFIKFKLSSLEDKFSKVKEFLTAKDKCENPQELSGQIRIIFDNLYIEAEYLRILIQKNLTILDQHSFNQHSGEDFELASIRNREHAKLKTLEAALQTLKLKLRVFYFDNFSKKKTRLILKDSERLEKIMTKEIAVNEEENKDISIQHAWVNGFICAILLITLGAIIVFRQINIDELETKVGYQVRFQIWRGASYLIIFNWVCAIVFYLLSRWNINYKLVLLEDDKTIGRASQFFKTAVILSVIFLLLFLVDILYRLNYFQGHDHINYLGYYMWLINIAFLLNPFKMLNYQSRIYFIYMFKKVLISPFRPMDLRILFLTTIISSFAQPINDFAFTISTLVNNNDKSSSVWNARVITFVVMLCFFTLRIIQGCRMHQQFGQGKCFSKARMRILAIVISILTVIASFLYALRSTQEMLIFWIVTGIMATVARSHSEVRADWNLLNFEQDSCVFRKSRCFSKKVYYIAMMVDPILDVAWVLTISNNVEAFFKINILYFFMLLGTIQLARRGLWMVLRIEDDHSINVYNLQAMADDSHIIKQIQNEVQESSAPNNRAEHHESLHQLHGQNAMKEETKGISHEEVELRLKGIEGDCVAPEEDIRNALKSEIIKEEVLEVEVMTLLELQELIHLKQDYEPRIEELLGSFKKYLSFVGKTYERITEEQQI